MSNQLYQSEFLINGQAHQLAEWQDHVIIVVNTATKCGFAPQFAGLQALHEQFKGQKVKVIGFPCDQFRHQEPETDQNMASFCEMNFGVHFDLTHKIEVNGESTHPIYQFLKSHAPGLFGSQAIKWNFTKFLISPNAETVLRFSPQTKPKALVNDINKMVAN